MRVRTLLATIVATMMTVSFGIGASSAAPAMAMPLLHQSAAGGAQLIDVSARKRRHHGNNAAAAAAFMGMVGGMMALAAQDSYRDRYYGDRYYGGPRYRSYDGYGYGYGPRHHRRHFYRGGGYYYGPGPRW